MVKRLVSLGAAVCILFAFLCIPVSAAELTGKATVSGVVGNSLSALQSAASSFQWTAIPYSTTQGDSFDKSVFLGSGPDYFFSVNHLTVPLLDVKNNVIVAFSYYLTVVGGADSFYTSGDLTPVSTWLDVNGVSRSGSATWNSFTPVGPNPENVSTGVTVSATFKASEVDTISKPSIVWDPAICYVKAPKKSSTVRLFVPSFRVIQTDASGADLEQLQDIAGGIAKSNQILDAMYGDILAVCNSIYERTGSILEAQQKTNELFASIIPVLNSLNTNVANIYSTLTTYFDLVLKAIDNQTVTLDQSIKDAEKALETYLKPMIDYFNQLQETTGESASTLPGHKADLDGFASDSNGIDDDAVTGLASLLPVFSAFSFVFSVLGIFVGLGIFLLIIRKGLS